MNLWNFLKEVAILEGCWKQTIISNGFPDCDTDLVFFRDEQERDETTWCFVFVHDGICKGLSAVLNFKFS